MLPLSDLRRLFSLEPKIPPDSSLSGVLLEVAQGLSPWSSSCIELQVLRSMSCSRLELYAYHRNAAAASCVRQRRWRSALLLLGTNIPRRNTSAAVNALKKAGHWALAVALLESLAQQRTRPDVSGHNALASALELSSWNQILSIVHFAALLDEDMTSHSLLRVSDWALAVAFWRTLQLNGHNPDTIGTNALMAPIAQAGQWQRAASGLQELFRTHLRRDGATYATAMDSCQRGSWTKALDFLLQMRFQALCPCRIQYTAVCDACAAAESWERALHVFDIAKMMDAWDALLGTSSLAAMSRSNQWTSAMYAFAALPEVSLEPNTITSTTVLTACERGRNWQMGLMAFSCMLEERLVNHMSFSTVMQACDKSGEWQLLFHLLGSMTSVQLQPTSMVYTAVRNSKAVPALALADIVTAALQPRTNKLIQCRFNLVDVQRKFLLIILLSSIDLNRLKHRTWLREETLEQLLKPAAISHPKFCRHKVVSTDQISLHKPSYSIIELGATAMADSDIQLAKVVELFTKHSTKDGHRA